MTYIDGNVHIRNEEVVELLRQHNELLKHQNTILSLMVDVLRDINGGM